VPFALPEGPVRGLNLNEDAMKAGLAPGESWWD
jgi:hypothetical protein